MVSIKEILIPGFYKVIEGIDTEAGLHCFIAIHSLSLGPSLGGVRIYPYNSPEEALDDVLRLAQGMTYKAALIHPPLGGGKSVIIAYPGMDKERVLLSFAEVINSLKGEYIAAEDVGSSPQEMLVLRRKTPYVVAMPTEKSSGDPSRFTAWGVFKGLQAVATFLWQDSSLRKKRILIQGLGNVGSKLVDILFWQGAELTISDLNQRLVEQFAARYGAQIVSVEKIYETPTDIFVPCAMGGILNSTTIPHLQCKAVAGSANNQLATPEDGIALMQREILYAPDYIINSGGLINAASELYPSGYNPQLTRDQVNQIYIRLLAVFQQSKDQAVPPEVIADLLARQKLGIH